MKVRPVQRGVEGKCGVIVNSSNSVLRLPRGGFKTRGLYVLQRVGGFLDGRMRSPVSRLLASMGSEVMGEAGEGSGCRGFNL